MRNIFKSNILLVDDNRKLREKIEENSPKLVYVLMVRGLGYKLAKE